MSDVRETLDGTARLGDLALPPLRTRPRLRWTDLEGAHEQIVDGRVVVGAAVGSGLLIADRAVSRVHAELEVREDGLWVRDLGSRNGTRIDGVLVTGGRVADGATLRVGKTDIVADYRAETPTALPLWPDTIFHGVVGRSVVMRALFATLDRLAKTDASVLIHGPTGTGKELVARAIHEASPRSDKPFVVVDCGALPPTLLDSELFGHAKGAFTGADVARLGAIEAAGGGTVFIDEIGELPLPMQPKLLRVLESRTIRRVGETTRRDIDVRFVSATHRDLLEMVGAGQFREDLYFRLAVVPVHVPPLDARRDDIPVLLHHLAAQMGAAPVEREVMAKLVARSWPGNVRELRNFVERARALGVADALAMIGLGPSRGSLLPVTPEDGIAQLPITAEPEEPASLGLDAPAKEFPRLTGMDDLFARVYRDFRESWIDLGEHEYVHRLLERNANNVPAAAREAEINRTHVYRLLKKHRR